MKLKNKPLSGTRPSCTPCLVFTMHALKRWTSVDQSARIYMLVGIYKMRKCENAKVNVIFRPGQTISCIVGYFPSVGRLGLGSSIFG